MTISNLSNYQEDAKFKPQYNITTLPLEWLKSRRMTMTSGSEDEELYQQLIPAHIAANILARISSSYAASESVNWHSLFGKHFSLLH